MVKRENLTLRQLLRRLAGGRGNRVLAGTPELIADHIIHWVEARAVDGFNLMPPYLPGGQTDFVEHVVPLLQQRGVFRRDYEGTMLRDHYGLARPASRFAT
jgi:alkanesulfonate monooxygenase SsuD/methylene tetrahydromethanopterin reductase-like flavin-dependent oxidoreductase (luciferase family)